MIQKILYPAALLFCIWLFTWGIPIDFFSRYPAFLSFAGSALGTVALTASIFRFIPKNTTDENSQGFGCGLLVVIVGFLFGFGVFLITHTDQRVEDEFRENGVYTMAAVNDGSSYEGSKFNFTSVKVTFYNEEGETRFADIDISPAEFKQHYLNEQLPIVYSRKYPVMARIIHNEDEYRRYAHIEVRDIRLDDLLHILKIQSRGETNDYLNSVNQKWESDFNPEDSTCNYFNEIKKCVIRITKNEVDYRVAGADIKIFRDELEKGGYKLVSGKPDMPYGNIVYSNGTYLVARRIEQESNMRDRDPSSLSVNMVTTVYILKLGEHGNPVPGKTK